MRRTRYEYQDFDLWIEPGAAGAYRAVVRDSPGGPGVGAAHFTQPFTREDVAGLVRLLCGRRRDLTAGTTEDDPPVTATIQQFGERLFRAVFTGEVEKCLRQSLREIDRHQDDRRYGLRIRLSFDDCPELADLPWEFLFDPVGHYHLCQSEQTSLVRYLPTSRTARPLPVDGPVRVLVVIASPSTGPGALDPFAGVAQTLTRHGVPAALAMQFPVSDVAAIAFAEGFYEAVAAGRPLDAATATGRVRVLTIPNDTEWATPVL